MDAIAIKLILKFTEAEARVNRPRRVLRLGCHLFLEFKSVY